MMILPDTHVLLWMAFDERERLSPETIELLQNPRHDLYYSLASLWEVSIKSSLHKPDFEVGVSALERGLRGAGFLELPIRLTHIVRSGTLPLIHRDPFDRLLLAQAETEKMRLITADAALLKYDSSHVMSAI